MGLTVHFEVLNQLGTPLMYSETLANRPAAGIAGRIFFRTDSPFGIYRDTGAIWDLIAIGGGTVDTNIYNTNGTLTANRTVSSGGFGITFNPSTTFDTTLTAANNASSLALFGVNRLSYAAAFSANNIGALYGASSAFALQTFAGSATFANSNIASGGSSVNSVDFSTGGSTITMTQATGLRAMAGHINMFQYQGTNSGTITHAAVSQNLGFYRPSAATGILTITNAYGHLINDLNDYGAGFTFTNRWGIYQAGASDLNYFASKVLIGSTTDAGQKLQVSGTGYVTGNLGVGTSDTSTYRVNINNTMNCNGNTFLASGSGGVVIGDITAPLGTLDIKSNTPVEYFICKIINTSSSRGDIGWLNSIGNGCATIRAMAVSSDVQATNLEFLTRDTTGAQIERLKIKSTGIINMSNVPLSSAGLVSGDIYQTAGVLYIVP